MIAFDAGSNSGVKATVSTYSFNHTTGSLTNGLIAVVVISRGAAANGDMNVSSVTYNGASLTKAVEVNSGDIPASATLAVSIWYRVAPTSGTNSVAVTYTGTVNHSVAYAVTLSGVDQTNPLDATNSSHALSESSPLSTPVTVVAANSWIIDGVYEKIGVTLSPGASQSLISTELFPNGGGDTADASYKGPVSAGANDMSWSWSGAADDYAHAVASFAPAAAAVSYRSNNLLTLGVS